jgi:hypothetical protein
MPLSADHVGCRTGAGIMVSMEATPDKPAAQEAAAPVTTEAEDLYARLEPPFSTLRAADHAVQRGEYAAAVEIYASVSAEFASAARQSPDDDDLHHALYQAHLGRLDALAGAGRLDELAALAETDNHARRRLDRQLHHERRADDLRARAIGGDRTALLLLIRLLRSQGEDDAARQAVQDLTTTDDDYAMRLAHGPLPGPWPPSPGPRRRAR